MKREETVLALILVLVLISGWNIHQALGLKTKIVSQLELARENAEQGNFESADAYAKQGLELWLKAEPYTHIFIRHAEIDSCTDAFYSLISSLEKEEKEGINAEFDLLEYHLNSIADMEIPKPGSIL